MMNKLFFVSIFLLFLHRGPESSLTHTPISCPSFGQSTPASARWKAKEPGNTCALTGLSIEGIVRPLCGFAQLF